MKKKQILITGGAGFIGSHVVKVLLESGYENLVIVDNLEKGHHDALLGGEFIAADLRDSQALDRIFISRQVDVVMHFAGFTLVGESMTEPARYFENNLVGGFNLLKSMWAHDVNKMIFSSSAAVYGEVQTDLISEDYHKEPANPYGFTKWAFEKMLNAYYHACGFSSVSLRYFCAAGADLAGKIGERHSPETHLIPLTIFAALRQIPVLKIFGTDYPTHDRTGVRDYIHVMDLAQGHVKGLELLLKSDVPLCRAYNLGIGRGYSVREIIAAVTRVTGRVVPTEEAPRRPGDPAVLVADSRLAQRELNWRPQYQLEDMIRHTYEFFEKRG